MNELEQYHYEQARAWLEHVRLLGQSADTALRKVEYEKAQMENLRGIDYTREHVSNSRHEYELESTIDNLKSNIKDYVTSVAQFTIERRDAYDRLAKLEDPTERDALTLRYCMNNPWEYVEGALNYSHQRIMQIRQSGIAHAYDVMPLEWRERKYSAI